MLGLVGMVLFFVYSLSLHKPVISWFFAAIGVSSLVLGIWPLREFPRNIDLRVNHHCCGTDSTPFVAAAGEIRRTAGHRWPADLNSAKPRPPDCRDGLSCRDGRNPQKWPKMAKIAESRGFPGFTIAGETL